MKILNKYYILFLLILCISCDITNHDVIVEYKIVNIHPLKMDGSKIEIDGDGFYRLKLNPYLNQSTHRITGFIRVNNSIPIHPVKIGWESNLYWWINPGDTLVNVTRTIINEFTGELNVIVLPPVISRTSELIPTINCCSYSGTNGEINTMIAPIYKMKGDTLIVQAKVNQYSKVEIIKIILE